MLGAGEDLTREFAGEPDMLPDRALPARADEGLPHEVVLCKCADEKYFNPGRARRADSEQARWKYPGVVEDQTVARTDELTDLPEGAVLPGATAAMNHQHARSCPIR